jgi:preprotein translocase subunit SecF
MEFFKIKRDIPFMSYGKLTTTISLLSFIAAVFFLVTKGLNLSVEFTGGTLMEVQYSQPANADKIRKDLNEIGLSLEFSHLLRGELFFNELKAYGLEALISLHPNKKTPTLPSKQKSTKAATSFEIQKIKSKVGQNG